MWTRTCVILLMLSSLSTLVSLISGLAGFSRLLPLAIFEGCLDDEEDLGVLFCLTTSELCLVVGISVPSLLLIIYILVQLFGCMCSRNYAEWRASWSDALKYKRLTKLIKGLIYNVSSEQSHQYLKSVPIKVTNRKGDIEFIHASRRFPHISTININGDIRVWDCSIDTAELTHTIDRGTSQDISVSFDKINGNKVNRTTSELKIVKQNVWCSDQEDEILVIGCEHGRFEIWNTITGQLLYSDQSNRSSVNLVKISNHKLVVTRLDGFMQVYQLPKSQNRLKPVLINANSHNCHQHTGARNEIQPKLLYSTYAHGQPITAIEIHSGHIITGGMDHLVKVYRFDSDRSIYSFREHFGSIMEIKADCYSASEVISGCQFGIVCSWDLSSGACIFSSESHQGEIISIITTPLYVITAATDNRICTRDKVSGNLIHTITHHHSLCKDLLFLAPDILITAKDDTLILWNIGEKKLVRTIELRNSNEKKKSYIKHMLLFQGNLRRAIICDLGDQLCIANIYMR